MYYLNWSIVPFCWPGFPNQRHGITERWWDLTWVPPVMAGSLKTGLCMGEEGVSLVLPPPTPPKHPTGQREEGTFGRCHSPTRSPGPSMGAGHPALCPQAKWSACCRLWVENSTQLWALCPGFFLCFPAAWLFNQSHSIY